jgi:nicotinate phosphoribosyltransferase
LDEYEIQELVRGGAPIDAFGVGTSLAVSDDAPALDMAYKLVEYAGQPRMKLSAKKVLYPGRKQFFRETASGKMVRDTLARADEHLPGEPQLIPVMRGGERVGANCASLGEAREHARRELERLPDQYHRLEQGGEAYPVAISDALARDLETIRNSLERSP